MASVYNGRKYFLPGLVNASSKLCRNSPCTARVEGLKEKSCVTMGLVVSVLAALPLLAQQQVPGDKDVAIGKKEAALGKRLAEEMQQRTTAIEIPSVQDYVDRLGRKLASNMPHAGVSFSFRVIAEDPCPSVHEPAALPGGYVFVPAALFLAAQEGAEFAGMLAHAMEHVTQRHGTRLARSGESANQAAIPLVFVGGSGGFCTEGILGPRSLVESRRSYELEADALAVQTMARAGFDPHALVRYTERVQPPPPDARLAALSSVPARDARAAAMNLSMAKFAPADYSVVTDDAFAAAREKVRQLLSARQIAERRLH